MTVVQSTVVSELTTKLKRTEEYLAKSEANVSVRPLPFFFLLSFFLFSLPKLEFLLLMPQSFRALAEQADAVAAKAETKLLELKEREYHPNFIPLMHVLTLIDLHSGVN